MTRRQFLVAAVLLPALFLAASPVSALRKILIVTSPEETFEMFQAAAKKDDVRQMVALVTDDTRDALAFQLLVASSYLKSFTECSSARLTDEQKKSVDQMRAILKKHDVTEAMIKSAADAPLPDPKNPEVALTAIRDLARQIKEPTAFVVDYSTAISRFTKIGGNKWAKGTLGSLKYDGLSATGAMTYKLGPMEKNAPIAFKQVGNIWKLELPLETLQPEPPDNR